VSDPTTVTVGGPESQAGPYDVVIGEGILDRLPATIAQLSPVTTSSPRPPAKWTRVSRVSWSSSVR